MEFDFSLITNSLPLLLQGALVTLEITAMAVGLGLVFGLLAALAQLSKFTPLRLLAKIYVDFIRGTPLLVQISSSTLRFPQLSDSGIDVRGRCGRLLDQFGRYVAEIFRSGISPSREPVEAGRSLGFNYAQTMWYIIMPQAFKTVLPTLCNEFISLLKETSVAGYIAIQDLTKGGDIIRSRTYSAFMPLIAVALIYLIIVMIFTKLIQILERRLRQNER